MYGGLKFVQLPFVWPYPFRSGKNIFCLHFFQFQTFFARQKREKKVVIYFQASKVIDGGQLRSRKMLAEMAGINVLPLME